VFDAFMLTHETVTAAAGATPLIDTWSHCQGCTRI
jgi:hypothetical protein